MKHGPSRPVFISIHQKNREESALGKLGCPTPEVASSGSSVAPPRISVLGKPADPLQAAASDPNRLGIRGGCREHPVSGAISSDRQHSSRTCRRSRTSSWRSAARDVTRPSIPHLNAARNGGLILPISDSFCPEDEVPADLGIFRAALQVMPAIGVFVISSDVTTRCAQRSLWYRHVTETPASVHHARTRSQSTVASGP